MTRMPTAPPLDSFLDKGIKSVLVVDFDGVFNCVRYQGRANSDFFEEEVYLADDIGEGTDGNEIYTLRWSTELVQEINAIASDPTVQVLWLTTWRENMGDIFLLLGLLSTSEAEDTVVASGNVTIISEEGGCGDERKGFSQRVDSRKSTHREENAEGLVDVFLVIVLLTAPLIGSGLVMILAPLFAGGWGLAVLGWGLWLCHFHSFHRLSSTISKLRREVKHRT